MENSGAANTERALVLYDNNQKTIKISSLYIDFTMYGPLPTKPNKEAKDVAAFNQSESFLKGFEENEVEAAKTLVDMKNISSNKPETAAATGPRNEPRYVSLRDLIGKKKI